MPIALLARRDRTEPVSRRQRYSRVRAAVALFFVVDEATITMETGFVRDLGADSLDIVETILALEEQFALTIEDEDQDELDTIRTEGDAAPAIDELRGQRPLPGVAR